MTFCKLEKNLNLHILAADDKCYKYAVDEIVRLLEMTGRKINTIQDQDTPLPYSLTLGETALSSGPLPGNLKWDAYRINITEDGMSIAANSAKGILNGVYDLAERFGFAFLLPGKDGEWVPEKISSLQTGEYIMNPRFPYRGVFWQKLKTKDYPINEWLEFYAKLRFNASRYSNEYSNELTEKLGLRVETGGHGLSKMLPRELFEEDPDLFRMFQPNDFRGKRMNDSNMCVTNPKTRKIIKENFKKILEKNKGAYAIHAWADDLPGGGWCLCPTCRAFPPEDQAMLAMRILAEAVRESGIETKIPILAYHDTMFPGPQIDAAEETFLLFAPRERCYGHTLDDPSCEQNKYYFKSLKEWMVKLKGIEDPHTFEYYFDQILFRGLYPFLPSIIAGDMKAYQEAGIETHMSLQVAGPAISPEYNMLIFSALHWDENLSVSDFCHSISFRITGQENGPLYNYLLKRAGAFEKAMRFCGHDPKVYMDFRWLPETRSEFGKEIAGIYLESSDTLNNAASELETSLEKEDSELLKDFLSSEVKRAYFEAQNLKVMHYQQLAMNSFAEYLNSENPDFASEGCNYLEEAVKNLKIAKGKAQDYKLPESAWYFNNINKWLSNEFKAKIENYRQVQ